MNSTASKKRLPPPLSSLAAASALLCPALHRPARGFSLSLPPSLSLFLSPLRLLLFLHQERWDWDQECSPFNVLLRLGARPYSGPSLERLSPLSLRDTPIREAASTITGIRFTISRRVYWGYRPVDCALCVGHRMGRGRAEARSWAGSGWGQGRAGVGWGGMGWSAPALGSL